MKKLLLLSLVTLGFLALGAPKSEARVFVNVGFGFPIGYGYNPYPAYGYGCYPYGNRGYYPSVYYGGGYRPYYWSHGRRIYYRRHCW